MSSDDRQTSEVQAEELYSVCKYMYRNFWEANKLENKLENKLDLDESRRVWMSCWSARRTVSGQTGHRLPQILPFLSEHTAQ